MRIGGRRFPLGAAAIVIATAILTATFGRPGPNAVASASGPPSQAGSSAPQTSDPRPKPQPEPQKIGDATMRQLRDLVERPTSEKTVLGVSLLVWRRGETIFRAASGNLTVDQKVQVASSSKPITAALTMMVVDEGKASLDDPLEKWIPEFADVRLKGGKKPSKKPTLRHVLANSSGLPGDFSSSTGFPSLFTPTLAQSARDLAKIELVAEPGAEFHYCTMGFNAAARVVEVVAGKPFDEFAQERLLRPLGMARTEYVKMGIEGRRPPGQSRLMLAGGAMTSTTDDLARFYRLVLGNGAVDGRRLLSEQSLAAMKTPQIAVSPDLKGPMGDSYGLAFFLDRRGPEPNRSYRTMSHAGVLGSVPWVDLDQQLIGVVFVQGRFADIFPVAFGIQEEVRKLFFETAKPPRR